MEGDCVDRDLWSFLDESNMNLLRKYADVLAGNNSKLVLKTISHSTNQSEADKENQASLKSHIYKLIKLKEKKHKITHEQKEQVYYLFWFVYYYVLECKTLEQALEQDHHKVLEDWKLQKYIINQYIFLGNDICLISLNRDKDIAVILEILYNRYNAYEQFDCYLRHFGDINDKRTAICKEVLSLYKSIKGKRFYDNSEND
jgi:hypothetical protein